MITRKPMKRGLWSGSKPAARPVKRLYEATMKKRNRSGRKKKAVSISRLKKTLEALQKQIVVKLYGTDCFTCPQKNLTGANCQLGHVPWPRSVLSTECKFDYHYTRIQCFRDNIFLGGMGAEAFKRMVLEGIDVEEMWERNKATKGKTVPRIWFESKIQEYESLLQR